jgi:6-phosphogluconolactonase
MSSTQILSFSAPEELAHAAADRFISMARTHAGTFTVALPGGRIYSLFFKCAAEGALANPGALDPVHFFWSDERCVPPDDPESNFKMAQNAFLGPLKIDPARVHRIRGEDKPELAAQRAEEELRTQLSTPTGTPVVDLVLLGMGEDGHVASLFPGETAGQIGSDSVFRSVVGPKPPPNRVTMSYKPLWAARHLWVLISGKEKAGALKQSLSPGAATPLGRVLARRTQSLIFTDCGV